MPHQPDLPCAGCGTLMWRGSTSLPEGQARCRACRKQQRCGTVNGYRKGCRCGECRAAVNDSAKAYRVERRDQGRPLQRKKDWISKTTRGVIYLRDGYTCQLCGCAVHDDGDYMAPDAATLDHIWPRALGGSDEPFNLRTACRRCNCERGANPEWEVHRADVQDVREEVRG